MLTYLSALEYSLKDKVNFPLNDQSDHIVYHQVRKLLQGKVGAKIIINRC